MLPNNHDCDNKNDTMNSHPTELECGSSLSEEAHVNQTAPSIPPQPTWLKTNDETVSSIDDLRAKIVADMMMMNNNQNQSFTSPFEFWKEGRKEPLPLPLVYCDQTASNRPLKSVEAYLQRTCLPFYGNTHTNTSITGSQSTAFVSEARQIVAETANAKITGKASLDVVLFA